MGSGKHGSKVQHHVGIKGSSEAHRAFCFRIMETLRLVCHVAHHLLLLAAVKLFPLLLGQIEDFSFSRFAVRFGSVGIASNVGHHCRHADSCLSNDVPGSEWTHIRMARLGGNMMGSQDPAKGGSGHHHLWHCNLHHFRCQEVLLVEAYPVGHRAHVYCVEEDGWPGARADRSTPNLMPPNSSNTWRPIHGKDWGAS